MRYLNKIVFINSASIAYGEVMVDGNIHFIGTQGVGKSTMLRSILFFYNADTLKLGISREKKNFAEYYLPFANSYIVYEVVKETGAYTIMAFKSQGKVCYRFLDTAYDRDLFIDAHGAAYESFDKIRALLDQRKIGFTRKIDRYEEYRDILYGNNEGKPEMRKYAFLESRQYQNIPRTIQNVFLNSKLEAEFIKETIIHSLKDEDVVIKLDTYQYQLKDFEEQLKDIRQFRQPAVQKQANQVADLYLLIKRQEREKLQLTLELEQSHQEAVARQPVLMKDQQRQAEKKEVLLAKLDDVKKRYDNKKEKLLAETSVLDDKLKMAKKKQEDYDRINILEVAERITKKNDTERRVSNLQNEKALLSAQYQETTQKFAALYKELENQHNAETTHRHQQQLAAKTDLLQLKDDIRKQYAQLVDGIRKQHQEKLAEANVALEDAGNRLTRAQVDKAEAKHRQLYVHEMQEVRDTIARYEHDRKATRLAMENLQQSLAAVQKQWEMEEQSRTDKREREKEKADFAIDQFNRQLAGIDQKLQNARGSLYEWLNQHKPGWNANIGKVCDEDVLYMSDLNPTVSGNCDTLFGVQIDMREITKTVKTADDYAKERTALQQQLAKVTDTWQQWKESWDTETEKLHKKTAVQLREKKEAIKEHEYSLQQFEQRLRSAQLQLNDLQAKAAADKQAALDQAEEMVQQALAVRQQSREAVKKVEDEIEKLVRSREKEREQKQQEAAEATQAIVASLDEAQAQANAAYADRKNELAWQQQGELQASGADTQRLAEIEQQLTLLLNELRYIEKNRDIVAEYKKDKRELLDRVDEFKNKRQQFQQQLLTEDARFNNQQMALNDEVQVINTEIQQLKQQLALLQEDVDEYLGLRQVDWYEEPAADRVEKVPNPRRCKDLARQIKELHYATIDKVNDVKEVVNKFLSHFSANNIFKFSAILIDKKEYLEFAEKLQQFIEDNRIAEFEKRVNERYASIIKLIGKETDELTSSEGEIQKIISRINNDFTQNNAIAVGVIQKIEMKMDESDNKVVQVLKLIQQFNAESGFELGAANLFSAHDSDAKNKKAVELLKQLIREIQNLRRDTITLSDSFEIKFRIVENTNDTGWVERLANVGSEGTDVLVKAMINIMLLNVFKEGASKRFKDFKLHCMMDEIGRLHPVNVRGILNFAAARNIWLINGSPTENDALAYRHIYKLEKDNRSYTRVKRILSQHNVA